MVFVLYSGFQFLSCFLFFFFLFSAPFLPFCLHWGFWGTSKKKTTFRFFPFFNPLRYCIVIIEKRGVLDSVCYWYMYLFIYLCFLNVILLFVFIFVGFVSLFLSLFLAREKFVVIIFPNIFFFFFFSTFSFSCWQNRCTISTNINIYGDRHVNF